MNIQAILEYQRADGEVRSLELEIERSELAKLARDAQVSFKAAKEAVEMCEREAEQLIGYYNKASSFLEENAKKVEDVSVRLAAEEDAVDTEKLRAQLSSLLDKVIRIEKDLAVIQKKAEEISHGFQSASKKGAAAKKNYYDNKEKFEAFKTEKAADLEARRAKLKKLEPAVDKELLAKYNTLRADKIFPIFVSFEEPRSCGGCRMEMSMGTSSLLKEKGVVQCEYCHRIVYHGK